jgi:hypothetical protein
MTTLAFTGANRGRGGEVSDQQMTVGSAVPSELGGPSELGAPGRAIANAALTPTAYVTQGNVPLGDWVLHGRRLGAIGRNAGWWIGDWLRYGNAKYGERYARASRITGYDTQTLMNMVYVASRFERSRRRAGLSWSHHAEVAALPQEEQEQWLTRVETDRLSVRCLRDELRRERRAITARQQDQPSAGAEPASTHVHCCPTCGQVVDDFAIAQQPA